MTPKITVIAAALSACIAVSQAAHAQEFASEYAISIFGLNVGKSKFRTTFSGNSYSISGTMRASGVARLLTSTTGSLTANGSLSSGSVTASAFDVRYKEGKTDKRTTISFSGGNVSGVSNSPAVKKKGDWVDVNSSHLKKVLDPMAAILVPAKSFRSVCNNTLKVYDGSMRADFPMRYLRTIPFSTKGYKGDAVTCRAKFKPISGYDRKKKDVIWMRDNGYIDVSFAPVGNTGVFAPVAAKVKTSVGTAIIRARRFQSLTN